MNEESRYQELEMDLKQIIKEEWEKEFPEQLSGYEKSVMKLVYEEIILSVARRVWNSAIETAENNAMIEEHVTEEYDEEKGDITVTNKEVYSGGYIRDENFVCVNPESILKLLINEQGTDTTQI
jgi:hypothetical protein